MNYAAMKTSTCYRKVKVDAHIPSATLGWNLSAWCYLPSDGSRSSPVIIMGHGLSCTKAMQLEPYAEAFAAAGYACLVFDYRRWGNSDGTPRHCVTSKEQLEDYTSVVSYCKTSHEFNRRPIVLWGFSAAGAHCLTLAAEKQFDVSSIIVCAPHTRPHLELSLCWWYLLMMAFVFVDYIKRLFNLPPLYIPAYARPGEVGFLNAPGAYEGFQSITLSPGDHINQVSASSFLEPVFCRPYDTAASISCPALIIAAEKDNICSFADMLSMAGMMPEGEVTVVSGGHFDMLPGNKSYDVSLKAQLEFLKRTTSLEK